MEARVGRLHCRYRVPDGDDAATAALPAIERVARERVAVALEESLERALGDDPAVYVLRRVDAGLIVAPASAPDVVLGRRWGQELAGAVVRRIAADAGDGSNLVRFDDEADYVARFLIDLLGGRAWDQWFYGSFRGLRGLAPGAAARTLLLEDSARLAAVLARLQRAGALERLLDALDAATLREVWGERSDEAEEDSTRPLLAAALRLAEKLRFTVQHGALQDLLAAYMSESPRRVDWRDRTSLADALLEAFRFVLRRVDATARGDPEELLDDALRELDWLDAARLRELLLGLLRSGPDAPLTEGSRLPLTPRQRRLLGELGALVARGDVMLDRARIDSDANALRLYAALLAASPEWGDDPLVKPLIVRALSALAQVALSGGFAGRTRGLRLGDVDEAWRSLPGASSDDERAAFAVVAELGPAGLRLAEELTDRPTGAHADPGIASPCAGVLLVVRAMHDLRLAGVVAAAGWPASPLQAMLAVALRWAGDAGVQHGRLDPALALLAGLEEPPTRADLRRAFLGVTKEDATRWQQAMCRALSSLGLAGGAELQVRCVANGDGNALVGGSERSSPFGCLLDEPGDAAAVLESWRTSWPDAPSTTPAVEQGEHDELLLDGVRGGRLGLPDVDLTLGLTAIALLRVWTAWLPGFEQSSPGFVLDRLVRRPGTLRRDGRTLVVELDRRPLDLVLELAGYTADLPEASPIETPLRFLLRDV